MQPLITFSISTAEGEKSISVYSCDIQDFDEEIDVLTVSAFHRNYVPIRRTMIGALDTKGISVEELSQHPEIDLRALADIWLSGEIIGSELPIRRIGCVEMSDFGFGMVGEKTENRQILNTLKAYFQMLDLAATAGVKMDVVALPILGAGNQRISRDLITRPILRECIELLKRNPNVRRIALIERPGNAFLLAKNLESSLALLQEQTWHAPHDDAQDKKLAFISYSTPDKNVADHLCAKLEAAGIRVWYAPRDIHTGDYASAIVSAIGRASHFIVIISKNSLQSQHVLNEIDLAFKELNRHIRFIPLRLDEEELGPAFTYYLSRQHWMDAHVPPLERRLEELVEYLSEELP